MANLIQDQTQPNGWLVTIQYEPILPPGIFMTKNSGLKVGKLELRSIQTGLSPLAKPITMQLMLIGLLH